MIKKRKILAVTGIRSEFDILYPIIDALRNNDSFEVKLAISGAHLSDWHGNLYQSLVEEGFEIADNIDSLLMTNRKTQRIKGVGLLTIGLSQTVEREQPAFLLVIGDREESIATALVGNYMNIPVIHYGGGDTVYGNADDPIRFAVSKLTHIHLTGAEEYARNLVNIGEEEFRVFSVGNPAYDNIRAVPEMSLAEISETLDFSIADGKYIVLLKHPLSSEQENAFEQMEVTLKAIEKFCDQTDFKVIGIYPNTDPGSYDIINSIKKVENSSHIRFFRNLPRNIFINIMRNAKALAGNSSMGILEAPFYKLPVVNIGNRQKGRLNAGNVEFVTYDPDIICESLKKACFDEDYRNMINNLVNPFGDGFTAEKIVNILKSIDLNDKKWYVKQKLC
jgi:GDP/UDP-N,N'-diacetylbacillosamine 2-epimerase (hydrolysing)